MKHAFAPKLRCEQIDAERRLWYALRSRRFLRFKFRRQQPIGPCVVDFVCFEKRVVIELDGDQHGSQPGLLYDIAHSRGLENDGFCILRFPNREWSGNFENVLEAILRALSQPISPLTRDPR